MWIESSETTYCIRGFYPMPVANKELAMARGLFTEHRAVLRTSETIRLGIGELFKSQQEESSPGTRQLGAQGRDDEQGTSVSAPVARQRLCTSNCTRRASEPPRNPMFADPRHESTRANRIFRPKPKRESESAGAESRSV
jgi:hypothetical protein